MVLKNGVVVESGGIEILEQPQHPYTQRLCARPQRLAQPLAASAPEVLRVTNLSVSYKTGFFGRPHPIVHDISFTLRAGETLGVVGGSGAGKSTLASALLHLLPFTGQIEVIGNGARTRLLQAVFQDPFGALSPRMRVDQIIAEGLRVHFKHLTAAERDAKVCTLMEALALDPATRTRHPHAFSGGQRQRIALARALILEPSVIVLDEPTSALDPCVQTEVLQLLQAQQARTGTAYVLISHDLQTVAALAHRVLHLEAGRVKEIRTL